MIILYIIYLGKLTDDKKWYMECKKKGEKNKYSKMKKKIKWLIFKNKNYEQRKNVWSVRHAECHLGVTQNKF